MKAFELIIALCLVAVVLTAAARRLSVPYPAFLALGGACLALIPGVSRSAASIIGGMQQKLTRNAAAEFSFFLAVPTMFAATCYDLYKSKDALASNTGNFQRFLYFFFPFLPFLLLL